MNFGIVQEQGNVALDFSLHHAFYSPIYHISISRQWVLIATCRTLSSLRFDCFSFLVLHSHILEHLQWAQQIAIFSYFVEPSEKLGLQSARYPAHHFTSSPSPSTNVASVFSLNRSVFSRFQRQQKPSN